MVPVSSVLALVHCGYLHYVVGYAMAEKYYISLIVMGSKGNYS